MIGQSEASALAVPKRQGRLTKVITVVVAVIAATAVLSGFLNTIESGRASGETRAGLAAQSRASERSIQVGRIFDADFDYISAAEVHAFTASEFDLRGLVDDAARERAIALYLLQSTYGYAAGYYSDALVENAVDAYDTTGFGDVWDAFSSYSDDLQIDVDNQQGEANMHLADASEAARRAARFTLRTVLMAVAVAVSTVALSTESKRLRYADLGLVIALYTSGWVNLALTLVS
ncbi:MAG: hypothetical protein ACREDF_11580 [Thermoplasmata archaeon]